MGHYHTASGLLSLPCAPTGGSEHGSQAPLIKTHVYPVCSSAQKPPAASHGTLDLTMPWCSSRSVCSHRSHFISCSFSPHSLHASHTGLLIPQTGQGQSHSGPLHVIFSLECPPFHGNLISSFLLDPYSEVSLSARHSLATATKISLPGFLLLITI